MKANGAPRILVVGGILRMQAALAVTLRNRFVVTTTSTASEGLHRLTESPPDLVILLALGEDDDLAIRAMRAQGAKERHALEVGKARVENDKVGPGSRQPVETFGSGGGRRNDEAAAERNGKGRLHPKDAPDHENPGSSISFHRRAPVIVRLSSIRWCRVPELAEQKVTAGAGHGSLP